MAVACEAAARGKLDLDLVEEIASWLRSAQLAEIGGFREWSEVGIVDLIRLEVVDESP